MGELGALGLAGGPGGVQDDRGVGRPPASTTSVTAVGRLEQAGEALVDDDGVAPRSGPAPAWTASALSGPAKMSRAPESSR